MLTQFPTGLVACVSDSYNIWNACKKLWGEELKELIEERGKNGGTLVVRPDSGDPPEVVVKVSGQEWIVVRCAWGEDLKGLIED